MQHLGIWAGILVLPFTSSMGMSTESEPSAKAVAALIRQIRQDGYEPSLLRIYRTPGL